MDNVQTVNYYINISSSESFISDKIQKSMPSLARSVSTNQPSVQAYTPKVAIDMLVFTLHPSRPGLRLG
jgi:hypothetical protein